MYVKEGRVECCRVQLSPRPPGLRVVPLGGDGGRFALTELPECRLSALTRWDVLDAGVAKAKRTRRDDRLATPGREE